RYKQMEAGLAAKRQELADLDAEQPAPISRALSAHQAGSVKALLDGLDRSWPTLTSAAKADLLAIFLERITVAHDGPTLTATLRWVGGAEQTIAVDRPGYRANAEAVWSERELAVLRESFAATP